MRSISAASRLSSSTSLLAVCRVYRFKAGEKREEFDKIVEHSFPQLLSIGLSSWGNECSTILSNSSLFSPALNL
jgi:hypothetical protein